MRSGTSNPSTAAIAVSLMAAKLARGSAPSRSPSYRLPTSAAVRPASTSGTQASS